MTENQRDRWARVATLLDAVLEREPAERAAYLSEACAGDEPLAAEVEGLLAGALRSSFLDSEALLVAGPLLEPTEFTKGSAPGGLPYELERQLGRGGTATVYLARDAKHGRQVAIKVLASDLTASLGAQRFAHEIRLTARLQHPHVLALLDSGVFGPEAGVFQGRPYYVMPYIEGESLRARLARGDTFRVSDALRVLREVADALHYAHEQGVVHRDIKPENILFSRDHAIVADFGIAKALVASQSLEDSEHNADSSSDGLLTQLSSLIGTPAYMAPEQATAGAALDYRADLYAWGVVAYELFAGRHPFGNEMSARELRAAYMPKTPDPLRDIAPAVPPEIAAVVMRCLAKAPDERPSSAADIVALLERAAIAPLPKKAPQFVGLRRTLGLGSIAVVGLLVLVLNAPHRGPTLVMGRGDPAFDVPAVQAAVQRGGDVILNGHFSFESKPTNAIAPRLAAKHPPAAEVLVSKAVTISGVRDEHGDLPTIEGGQIPFYIDAPGSPVAIRGLHFIRPTSSAILVYAVRGLEISGNQIERLVPFANTVVGIEINTSGELPNPTTQGAPENISGQVVIRANNIDAAGGSNSEGTWEMGILVFGAGRSPDEEVILDVIGNQIKNTTASAINIRRVNTRVRVVSNNLQTSRDLGPNGNEVLRVANTGAYLIANNSILCQWANGTGITVFSQFAEWPMERATVEDNDVLMSPPAGTVFGDSSAGITVRGVAHDVLVRHNSIRGRARAGVAVYISRGGVPESNTVIDNLFDGFTPTVADIYVGTGVRQTRVVRPRTVKDDGEGTIISRPP